MKPLLQEDYYINEKGLMVFTAKYHLKRGFCCGNGCIHCPFQKDVKSENFNNPKK
ncbi:MAG: hypothetical protein H7321_01350 [Bacteroidia bacterium]|nr:hypothetical protein [Bacteroidia bacterium]